MKNLLKVLRFFCANPGKLYICAEIAKATAIQERSVNNYLHTLEKEGFLRHEARAYRLSEAVFVQGVQSVRSLTRRMANQI